MKAFCWGPPRESKNLTPCRSLESDGQYKGSCVNKIMIVLAQRGWQAFSGLLTLYFVTKYLGPEEQGYYYTVSTLIGFLLALDLGLTNILVPFAAKYAPAGGQDGEAFYGIGGYAARWFQRTGLLMLVFIPVGMFFLGFHEDQLADKDLDIIWALVVLASVANYIVSPYVLLLEGSGKVKEVYRNRLNQGVLSAVLMWLVLVFGGGVLAIVVPPLVGFLYTSAWLSIAHPTLLKQVSKSPQVRQNWSKKVWPLQWRTGTNVFSGYLLVFLYTPMAFLLFGPKEAGQLGLTMTCMNTVFVLSISGLVGKFPRLTQLLYESKAREALSLYRAEMRKATAMYMVASAGLIIFLMLFQGDAIASRFLSLGQTICIVIAMFFYMRASAHGYLMRAHLVDYSLKFNLLSVACVFIMGTSASYWFGLWGILLAMLVVFAGLLAPSMSRIVEKLE